MIISTTMFRVNLTSLVDANAGDERQQAARRLAFLRRPGDSGRLHRERGDDDAVESVDLPNQERHARTQQPVDTDQLLSSLRRRLRRSAVHQVQVRACR